MAFCRKCGDRLIEQSRFCSRCGTSITRPVQTASSAPAGEPSPGPASSPAPPVATTHLPPPVQLVTSTLRCPRCHSDSIQNIRVLYEGGTTRYSGSANTVGVAWSPGHGVGVGTASTSMSGTQQSLLAQRYAPPARRDTPAEVFKLICCFGMLAGVFLIGMGIVHAVWRQEGNADGVGNVLGMVVFGVVLTVVCRLGLAGAMRQDDRDAEFNRTEWPRLYNEWQQCWLCHRCGFFGLLGPPQG